MRPWPSCAIHLPTAYVEPDRWDLAWQRCAGSIGPLLDVARPTVPKVGGQVDAVVGFVAGAFYGERLNGHVLCGGAMLRRLRRVAGPTVQPQLAVVARPTTNAESAYHSPGIKWREQ